MIMVCGNKKTAGETPAVGLQSNSLEQPPTQVGTAVIAAKPPTVKLKAALNHGGKVTEVHGPSMAM
jgi:hypothetical protein